MPDLTAVKTALKAQRIETPSWAFGNTGTRFKVFAQPGVPRTVTEKIDDAAQVHRYTGDQCHNIEPKIPAQIRSVMNVQEATAKALLVDTDALHAAQQAGDVLGANGVFMDAYNTDVRPLLAELRTEQGLAPDPMAAYAASGYPEKIVADRVGGTPAGWNS